MTAETTNFTALRQLLDTNERAVVLLREDPARTVAVIRDIEQGETMLAEMRAAGIDVRAEEGRLDSLRGRLIREAPQLVRRAEKAGIVAQLDGSALWSEMRILVNTQQAQQRRRFLIGGAVVLVLALLVFVVLPRVFPTPPSANTIAVAQIAAEGDYQAALDRALSEQQQAPNDEQIGVWIGGLQQKLGRQQEAEASFAAAKQLGNNDVGFYTTKIGVALTLGDFASAEQDVATLSALPDGAAIGTYELGALREAQGRKPEAMAAYEKASQLANDENKPELVVAARTRLGMLMQNPQ